MIKFPTKKSFIIILVICVVLIAVVYSVFSFLFFSEAKCKKLLKEKDNSLNFENMTFAEKENTPYGEGKTKETKIVTNGIGKFVQFYYSPKGFLGCFLKTLPLSTYSIPEKAEEYECKNLDSKFYLYYKNKNNYLYVERLNVDNQSKTGDLKIEFLNNNLVNEEKVLEINQKFLNNWLCQKTK